MSKTEQKPSPDDVDVLLECVIGDGVDAGLKALFLDPKRQKALVVHVCDEAELTGVSRLLVRISVNLLARLCVAGGNRLNRILKDQIQDKLTKILFALPGAKRVMEALQGALANVDAISDAEQQLEDLTEDLMGEAVELGDQVGLDLRTDIAILDSLRDMRGSQTTICAWIKSQSAPQFKRHQIKPSGANRFYFGSQTIPFIPRQEAFAALDTFLDDDTAFRWGVVHGPGGTGKSRLALEFALARSGGWTTGFLSQQDAQPEWRRWRPQTPHLLIIDYPTSDPEGVGAVLRGLSDAAADACLDVPVRVLLLEREAEGEWRKTMLKSEGAMEHITPHETVFEPLQPLEDIWSIYDFFFEGKDLPDKAETLAHLEKIDPEMRPLYAAFHADALHRGDADPDWDRESLVRYTLDYEEQHYWQVNGATTLEPWKRLAALITLSEGLAPEGVKALCEAFPDYLPVYSWDEARFRLSSICGPLQDGQFPALQPDILGELFLLDQFCALEDPALVQEIIIRCSEIGGQILPVLYRAETDFQQHEAFSQIECLVAYQSAFRLYRKTINPIAGIIATQLKLDFDRAFSNSIDFSLKQLLFIVAANMIASFGEIEGDGIVLSKGIYESLKNRSNHPALRKQQARAAFNLNINLGRSDLAAAQGVYADLKALSASHPAEPAVRESLAKAAFNLIADLGEHDLAAAQGFYADLKALSASHPAEPAVREEQAKAATNLIADLGEHDLAAAQGVYADLKALSASHPAEPAVREEQAKAATNLIIDLAKSDLAAAQGVYADLKALSASHSNEPAVREPLAKAAFNLIADLGEHDLAAAQGVYADLKALSASHPAEPAVREEQAKAATNLIIDLAKSDLAAAQGVYADLKGLSASHSNEPAVRESQAKAAFNLIADLGEHDLAAAQGVYADLKALSASHPAEPAVRESLAKAAFNLIADLGEHDLAAAQGVYADLKALSASHPAEPAVREEQAKAATNLIIDLAKSDLAAAQGVYADLKGLSASHSNEPAVRESQAKAAFNLIADLGKYDLAAAQGVYADLKALSASHSDEPALRELQAKAATNLIAGLGESDLPAAQGVYEELKGLSASHSDEPALREAMARATGAIIWSVSQSDMEKAREMYTTEKGTLKVKLDADLLTALERRLGL
ncbi:hypothetical protein ABWI01_09105 [Oceanicaulis alexandrii]|uniref:hypothetical protein n=1 Tax=Oceanicaulis alexandrii TaxID=153233 RepID=UPI0035CFDF44